MAGRGLAGSRKRGWESIRNSHCLVLSRGVLGARFLRGRADGEGGIQISEVGGAGLGHAIRPSCSAGRPFLCPRGNWGFDWRVGGAWDSHREGRRNGRSAFRWRGTMSGGTVSWRRALPWLRFGGLVCLGRVTQGLLRGALGYRPSPPSGLCVYGIVTRGSQRLPWGAFRRCLRGFNAFSGRVLASLRSPGARFLRPGRGLIRSTEVVGQGHPVSVKVSSVG